MAVLLRAVPGAESTRPVAARILLGCALALAACAGTPRPLPDTAAVAPPAAPAGDVAVHLVFGPEADLDLFVTDPMHEEIYFANSPSRLGGVFEGDRRCGDPAPRVETIRFSPAPAGRYRVSVDYPKRCDAGGGDVPYRVIVEAEGQRREVDGEARFGKLEHIVLEFDVSGAGRGSATDPEEDAMSRVTVQLPETPFWPNEALAPSPELLDELAAEYAAGRGTDPLEMARFLYGRIPVVAFDRIFAGTPEELPTAGILWLFHLSGYYGGVWLRAEIDAAQPASQLAGVAVPPSEAGFAEMAARAREALDAAGAADADVIAYCERSLFPSGAAAGATDGLVDNFGYNLGYLLEILEAPPEGLRAPDAYRIRAGGPLSCEYASPKLTALPRLREVERALAEGRDPRYAALAAEIDPVQEAGVAKGRAVWSSGLSVQGFGQEPYDQLLDVSSSYLEVVQATALATVKAVTERDVAIGRRAAVAGAAALGRRAAVAGAAMGVWLSSYTMGLLEGRPGDEVPAFGVAGEGG